MPQLCKQCNKLSVVMHDEQGPMLGLAATSVGQDDNTSTNDARFKKYGRNNFLDTTTNQLVTLQENPGYNNKLFMGPLTDVAVDSCKRAEKWAAEHTKQQSQRQPAVQSRTGEHKKTHSK
eukprot:1606726-Rhodomonas_salina.1